MDNRSTFPFSSTAFKDIGRNTKSVPGSFTRKSTLERLATPKPKDRRWIPDRPSVYWLDYIIDPTPHKLKDPGELAAYYDKFEPRFPRTKLLSAPRSGYGTCEDDDSLSRPISVNTGIPISALTYKASERIKELARPKTSISGNNNFTETSFTGLRPSTSSRQSLLTAQSQSSKGILPYFDPSVDLARGDFPSRSKHRIHRNSSTERTMPASVTNFKFKPQFRSSTSYRKAGSTVTRDILRNDKKRPISRTLYSGQK